MLSILPCVRRANIVTTDAQFDWDEWNVKEYYLAVEDPLFDRIDRLTTRAGIGLAIACGEWVCHRFSALSSDPDPLLFLEAAWAGNIHIAYCRYTENADNEWRGVIRGPLNMTMTIVNDGLFCLEEEPSGGLRAAWMHKLARHVLPQLDAFDEWFEAIVTRLEQHYLKVDHPDQSGLFDDSPDLGPRVPREAYDPDHPFDPTQTAPALDAFLSRLTPDRNPYLRPADELSLVDGLPGTPYHFVEPNEDEE